METRCEIQTECNNLRAEIKSVLAEIAQYRANLDEVREERDTALERLDREVFAANARTDSVTVTYREMVRQRDVAAKGAQVNSDLSVDAREKAERLEEEKFQMKEERDEALRDLEESEAKNGIKYTIRLERERDAARHDRNEAQTERDAAREEIVFLKKIKEGQAGMVGILCKKKDKAWQCQNEALCERNEALKEVESLSANVDRLKGNWLRFEKILKSDLDAAENERDSVRNALEGSREELSISRKATRAWKQKHDEKCKGCELLGAQRKVNEISTEKDAERVKYERTIKPLREENESFEATVLEAGEIAGEAYETITLLQKERDQAKTLPASAAMQLKEARTEREDELKILVKRNENQSTIIHNSVEMVNELWKEREKLWKERDEWQRVAHTTPAEPGTALAYAAGFNRCAKILAKGEWCVFSTEFKKWYATQNLPEYDKTNIKRSFFSGCEDAFEESGTEPTEET